jgi:phosphoribosylglycinamide formyltransferase-1
LNDVRLAMLVSGSGTILESVIDFGIDVSLVLSDRPCRALQIAEQHGISRTLLDRRDFGGYSAQFDRVAYSDALTQLLIDMRIDLIAMAGFGTIVTDVFHEAFPLRVLNTHPSLLPAFKGWHAVREALNAGASVTGCTVHVATVELDDGPILAQRSVAVVPGDSEESLHERIKLVEREIYPLVISAAMTKVARRESVSEVRID